MANIPAILGYTSGLTNLYVRIREQSGSNTLYVWYTVTPAFELFNAAHVSSYVVSCTESGTSAGDYYFTMPSGINTLGDYSFTVYQGLGATSDVCLTGATLVLWSGSAVIPWSNLIGVPAVAPGNAGALIASGTGTAQLNTSSGQVLQQYGTSSGQINLSGGNLVALPSGIIDIPQLSAALAAILSPEGYLYLTVSTTPVTADTYRIAGIYQGVVYWESGAGSSPLGTPMYLWYQSSSTKWILSSTAPGVTLPAAYYATAAASNNNGVYSAQGTATGTPVINIHGTSRLAAFQPEQPWAQGQSVIPAPWFTL